MIYFTAHTFKCVCHCRRAMFRVLGMYNFGINKSSECPFVSDNDVCVIQKSKEVCNKIRDFSKIASILGWWNLWNCDFIGFKLEPLSAVFKPHCKPKPIQGPQLTSESQKKLPSAVVYYYCDWYLFLQLRR